jgi:hypothetical protein
VPGVVGVWPLIVAIAQVSINLLLFLVFSPLSTALALCFFQVHTYFKWFLVLGSSWWYLVFLLHVGFPTLYSQTLLEVYKLIEEERFLTLKTTECSLWDLSLACKLHLQQPTKPCSVHSNSKPSKKELAWKCKTLLSFFN